MRRFVTLNRFATWSLLAIVALSRPNVHAQSSREAIELSALTSYDNVQVFVASFKKAVRERNCFDVAALTQFPLRVNWSRTRTRYLWNRTALCRYFPVIFDEAV